MHRKIKVKNKEAVIQTIITGHFCTCLPWHIATHLVVQSRRNVFSPSSAQWKTKLHQGHTPSRALGGNLFLASFSFCWLPTVLLWWFIPFVSSFGLQFPDCWQILFLMFSKSVCTDIHIYPSSLWVKQVSPHNQGKVCTLKRITGQNAVLPRKRELCLSGSSDLICIVTVCFSGLTAFAFEMALSLHSAGVSSSF